MASPENKSGSKLPAILGIVLVAVLAVGAFFFLNQPQPSGLYVYYPENTSLFVEFEPGEKLAKSVFTFKEGQETPFALLKEKGIDIHADALEDNEIATRGRVLSKEFNTLFKPHVGFGAWTSKVSGDEGAVGADFEAADVLMVLPLIDPEMEVEAFIPKMEATADDFDSMEHEGVKFLVEKEVKSGRVAPMSAKNSRVAAMAVLDGNFMVTSGEETMKSVIDHVQNQGKNVLDNPANRSGISKLPKNRIATIVVNLKSAPKAKDPTGEIIQNMMPYAYGSGQLDEGKYIANWDVYIPLYLDELKERDAELHGQVKEFLKTERNNFKAASALPEDTQFFVSLGRVDDLLHIVFDKAAENNSEFQKNISGAKFMLGMMELDLEKDLIGFVHEELVLAVRKGEGPLEQNQNAAVVLTPSTTGKKTTLEKLIGVASGGMLPVQHKNESISGTSVDTFVAPGQPQRISVAQLDSGMIAFTDPTEMDFLIGVSKNDNPPLKDTQLYKAVTESLPAKGTSMLFLDMENVDEKNDSIEAMAGTFDSDGDKGFKARLVIKLKPEALD